MKEDGGRKVGERCGEEELRERVLPHVNPLQKWKLLLCALVFLLFSLPLMALASFCDAP